MNINRDNYEEFFVLYIDKELNAADRSAVEAFVAENPDLETELEMLQQTILASDNEIVFLNKNLLLKPESEAADEVINELNCEEYFVMYGDNELSNDQNAEVEDFIYRHPQYQEHFELIQQVKFQPEKHVVFPDKSILYRKEEDSKVVPMFTRMRTWKMVAAAAVMLMIAGTVWYALDAKTAGATGPGLNTGVASNKPAITPNTTISKNKPTISQESSEQNPAAATTTTGEQLVPVVSSSATSTNPANQYATKKSKKESNIINVPDVKHEKSIDKKSINNRPDLNESLAHNKVKNTGNEVKNTEDPENKKALNSKALVSNNTDQQTNKDQALAMNTDDKKTPDESVAIGPVQLKDDNVFSKLANENDEEFEQSDKKNKMRGFFRKVTRVFDKATSREPAENRKGVRIASFSIGLK